ALAIQPAQLRGVLERDEVRHSQRVSLRRLRASSSDVMVRESDVGDVRVAARHVAGGAVVVLLLSLGRIQRAAPRGMAIEALLTVVGGQVLRLLRQGGGVGGEAGKALGAL